MTDDTDHPPTPPDAKAPAGELIHLPEIKVERSPEAKTRKSKAKAKSAKPAKPSGKAKKQPNLSVAVSADFVKTDSERGRPSVFRTEFVEQAERLCRLGATDVDLAEFFSIDISTLYRWKLSHADFCEALKAGKEIADERVERSLYQRAVGYSFKSEKVFQYQGQIVRGETREHVPADVTADIFWLKNRRPDKWRDVQKVDHTHQIKSAAELLEEIQRDIVELGLLPDGSYGPAGGEG